MSCAPLTLLSTSPSPSTTSLAESVSSITTTSTTSTDTLSLSSSESSSESSNSNSLASNKHSIRPNEHLAILMHRSLWKRDSLSNSCDTFSCSTIFSSFTAFPSTFSFSTFERRHHCRKCGGVFCSKCTLRTTPLLDTRDLPFLNPPRNTSIYDYVSEGGIVDSHARVCDDCWDQLHGTPSTPQTPELKLSMLPMPQPPRRSSVVSSGDTSPASSTSPRTPPDTPLLVATALSSTPITRRSSVASRASIPDFRRRATTFAAQAALPKPSDIGRAISTIRADSTPLPLGELATYPLCRSSLLCKASGGGRWVPRPAPTLGIGKPLWEVEWERRIRKEKRRRENPVVRDGEFCYRVYGAGGGSKSDDDDDAYDVYDLEKGLETVPGVKDERDTATTTLGRSFSLSTF
ncbi:FYVE-domain-containing protein [Lentinula detonsa]|uniref:FYVE-domain-containing protein n=1 Tax=Lentinula detonsa TaxID=2804962 RepID=A0A9W8PCL9_9AGAR|nr:FYVE-domain-containing protein [Lentinula detonsa]